MQPFKVQKEQMQITSVQKALRILKLFSHKDPELGVSEISRRLGIAKSTVSRLVQILCQEGLLKKNPETRKYHLSLTVFEIGSIVYQEIDIVQVALPLLKKLLPVVNGVIQLAIYDNGGIVYLLKLPEHHDQHVINSMGKRVPAHLTAAGKALLAFQSDEEIAQYISKPLERSTEQTITCSDKLWNELIKIRESGYSTSFGEYQEMVGAVAIPIMDEEGKVMASLSVTKPKNLLNSNQIQRILPEMKMKGRIIAERLEGMTWEHPLFS